MADVKPVRLQLSRKRGFDLQANSMSINGLSAVKVTRPGKWGNPFVVSPHVTAEKSVELFREVANSPTYIATAQTLRGKNLACWCKPGEPCHADVLLEIANR